MATGLFAAPARAASGGSGGSGAGTAAAEKNPDCDPDTGRVKFPSLAAPLCVKEWKDGADNGGKTAQGVTKDTIKVVVLYTDVVQDERSPATLYRNQATGTFSNQRDTIIDADALYAHSYETWGRKVEYEFVKGSGADETAQRADAIAVASKKPFAVFDAAIQGGNQSTGGLIFETVVEQKGVPLVLGAAGAPPRPPKDVSHGVAANVAEFAGKSLVGKKAEYGGDAVKDKTRSFGILYQGGEQGFDIDFFKSEFAKYGGKLAPNGEAEFTFPPGTSQADATSLAQQQMPTLMARLKDSGVTTIIEVLDARYGMRPGMLAATSAEYFPEWLIGSGGPSGGGAFPGDLPILVRAADKQQMAHAFGLLGLPPYVANQTASNPFQWFWGTNKGSLWSGAQAMVGAMYSADPPRGARSHRRQDEARGAAVEARRRTVQQRGPHAGLRIRQGRQPDHRRHARLVEHRHHRLRPGDRGPRARASTCTSTAPSGTPRAASRRTRRASSTSRSPPRSSASPIARRVNRCCPTTPAPAVPARAERSPAPSQL